MDIFYVSTFLFRAWFGCGTLRCLVGCRPQLVKKSILKLNELGALKCLIRSFITDEILHYFDPSFFYSSLFFGSSILLLAKLIRLLMVALRNMESHKYLRNF